MKKRFLIAGLAAVLILCSACSKGNEDVAPVASVAELIGGGTVGVVDRFSGVVSAQDELEIKRDENYEIKEIKVEVGDEIGEGTVLFTYDTEQMDLDLQSKKLELEQMNLELSNLRTQKSTLQSQMASAPASEKLSYQIEINQTDTDILEKNYNIKQKQQEISSLEATVKSADVKSTINGVVKSINESGQTDNYGNQLPFMVIAQTGELQVKAYVNEANVYSLYQGMEVIIRSRVNENTWSGTVATIDLENPQTTSSDNYYSDNSDDGTSSSSKYPFTVQIADNDGLMLGQHVYIEPDYGQDDVEEDPDAIKLAAYYIMDVDTAPYVWAQSKKGKIEKRLVALGEYDEMMDTYVIVDGLTKEDYIAFPDESIHEGMKCVDYETYLNEYYNEDNMNDGQDDWSDDGVDGEYYGDENLDNGSFDGYSEDGAEGDEIVVDQNAGYVDDTFDGDLVDGLEADPEDNGGN